MAEQEDNRKQPEGFRPAEGRWFRDLFEHVPLCVFEEDFSSDPPHIVQANQRAVEVYGWSRRELLELDPRSMVPPEAQPDFVRITEAVQSGQAIAAQSVNRRRDGTVFPVRVSASATTREGRAIVMVEDISAERQADSTLRALLNATHDRALLLETDGTIVELNAEAARSLGGTAEELKGRIVSSFFPEELTLMRRRYTRAVIETGRPQRWEDHRDGCILENSVYPVSDSQGNVVRLACFARDVTEHRRAQTALRRAKQRLQSIVDNTWDIIFQMDLAGNYTFGNKAAERVLGYRLDQLLEMNFVQVVAPEYVAMVRQRLRARIEGKDLPQPFSFDCIRADGRRVTLELATTTAYEDEKLLAVQGVARDITERRRAERALQEAHRKLLTAREDERRHVARELHDSIGQQLAGTRLMLRNALGECDAGKVEAARGQLVRASEMCNAMVAEVREICQGLYPAALESLGLSAALRELCSQCSQCGGVDGACRCEFNGPQGNVRFRPEVEIALFRIAQEALNNALRHAKAEHVRFDLEAQPERVTLRVTDDGVGFDPKTAAGNGLGLTSMAERVEVLGGELKVNSRPGHTEVSASVPIAETPAERDTSNGG